MLQCVDDVVGYLLQSDIGNREIVHQFRCLYFELFYHGGTFTFQVPDLFVFHPHLN